MEGGPSNADGPKCGRSPRGGVVLDGAVRISIGEVSF